MYFELCYTKKKDIARVIVEDIRSRLRKTHFTLYGRLGKPLAYTIAIQQC